MNLEENRIPSESSLWVYILECGDGTLYTGMTTDLEKRVRQHQYKKARCKFTRRADKHPLWLRAAWELSGIRGDALTLERYIKRLNRAQKLTLLKDGGMLQSFMDRDGLTLACELTPYQGDLYDLEESL